MIMVIYLLTALFLGGFGNYLIPLMVGARDMVFPYANMLSYWVYLLAVVLLVSASSCPAGPPARAGPCTRRRRSCTARRARLGHHPDARLAGGVHHRVHHGRAELRGDRAAGAHAGHDADAHAADGVGHLHGHHPGAAGLSGAVRQRHHDAAGPTAGHQLLHARHRLDGAETGLLGRQPAAVPAPVLVLRPSRGLHRRAAGLRHRLRPDQRACAQEHLRLSHDGVGDRGHRRPELRRVGAPHVRQRHEPVLRLLLRHHHADHRGAHGDQGLQLGADAVARQHPPHRADAVRHRRSSSPSSTAA